MPVLFRCVISVLVHAAHPSIWYVATVLTIYWSVYQSFDNDVNHSPVSDYSCALQRDILVQGRLYVSQNHICFYAKIIAWETNVSAGLMSQVKMPNTYVILWRNPVRYCMANNHNDVDKWFWNRSLEEYWILTEIRIVVSLILTDSLSALGLLIFSICGKIELNY